MIPRKMAEDLDRWLQREDLPLEPSLSPVERQMLEQMTENHFISPGQRAVIKKALDVIDYLAGDEG